jgi:hypothetical protein
MRPTGYGEAAAAEAAEASRSAAAEMERGRGMVCAFNTRREKKRM